MNQKELLYEEEKKYWHRNGMMKAYLVVATACSIISIFYVMFLGVTIACLILMMMCINECGKLNLKWTAEYNLKKEGKFCRSCGNKVENKN